jgi:hypothetical protein
MNRLVFNLQAEYNILGSYLFSSVLGTIAEEVTPIGDDLDHATFTEWFTSRFTDPVFFDIKKSDCGYQKEHVEVMTDLWSEIYGADSLQVGLWKAVMGLDKRFKVIFHLTDGTRYVKRFVGYLFSGMWCTTSCNSFLYWMESTEMGFTKCIVMGDDGVLEKSSNPKEVDLVSTFKEYGHEFQGDKFFCSRKIMSPDELRLAGPTKLISRKILGTEYEDINPTEIIADSGIHLSLNVNPQKSVMNMLANRKTINEATISAARNFAADPNSFLEVLAQKDKKLAEEIHDDFEYQCSLALAARVWDPPRRAYCTLVEWSE